MRKKYDTNYVSESDLKCYETEFLIYEKKQFQAYLLTQTDGFFLCEYQFEKDVLSRYETALFYTTPDTVQMFPKNFRFPIINVEILKYENGSLSSFLLYDFSPPLSLTIKEYTFSRDNEGCLSTYKSKRIYGFKPDFDYGDNPPENWVYQVLKSCKNRTVFNPSQGWI